MMETVGFPDFVEVRRDSSANAEWPIVLRMEEKNSEGRGPGYGGVRMHLTYQAAHSLALQLRDALRAIAASAVEKELEP